MPTAHEEPPKSRIAVLLAQYPPDELERRKQAVLHAAPAGVEIGFRQLEGSVYRKGLTNLHRALVAPLIGRAAVEAEQDGFDAIVPYGTLDLGVEETRHLVDIPMMGPGRTGAHAAAMLAERFVVVCYDQPHVVMFRRLLPAWRVDSYVTSIRPVGAYITDMAKDPDGLRELFVTTAKAAVEEEDAELILPLGMTMVPVLLSASQLTQEIGLPVLDPLALTLRMAEGLASTGFVNSRAAYPPAEL